MLVLYYFQCENGESYENPNAFMVSDGEITYGQFCDQFPCPVNKSALRFRFRTEDEACGYVWQDISDPNQALPIVDGVVFAKILRLDSISQAKRKMTLRRKAVTADGGSTPTFKSASSTAASTHSMAAASNAAAQPSSSSQRASPPPAPVPAATTSPLSAAVPASTSAKQNRSSAPSPAPAASAKPERNLLDDDGDDDILPSSHGQYSPKPPASSTTTQASSVHDIDEDTTPSSASPAAVALSREELAARKDETISDKVKAALEFKKELDAKAVKEQDDFDAARDKYDKALLSWSTNNKEKRNVRTLLSTMHTVLPPNSKWKALGLGDVLQASDVKKHYRKAMRVVHPDHTVGLDSESKFICRRIFEALNEAYEEFSKKENP